MNVVQSAEKIFSFLEGAATEGPTVLSFITGAINAAEQKGGQGADKLQSVLMAAELLANKAIPQAMKALQDFLNAVRAFVDATVAIYNEAKLFLHGVGVG